MLADLELVFADPEPTQQAAAAPACSALFILGSNPPLPATQIYKRLFSSRVSDLEQPKLGMNAIRVIMNTNLL